MVRKEIAVPVLIDGSGKTRARYGIGGIPSMLLIDSEGHLVKRGEKVMLEEKLRQNPWTSIAKTGMPAAD